MNLTNAQARQIIRGAKTEHRIAVEYSAPVTHRQADETWQSRIRKPASVAVADILQVLPEAVNLRDGSKTSAVHAEVSSLRCERLGAVDLAGARAEGHATLGAFKAAWTTRVDRVSDIEKRWCYFDGFSIDEVRALLVARFERRHAGTEVWVVGLRPAAAAPRLLAAGSRGGDYTRAPGRSLDPDAPCVDDLELQRFAKAAAAHRMTALASFRDDLEAERRARKNAAHTPPWRRAA